MTHEELVAKYPLIFTVERYPSVSKGWIPLLDALCDRLQGITDLEIKKILRHNELYKEGKVEKPYENTESLFDTMQIKCIQCKEKFGGLRFYTRDGLGEKHLNIIHEYEILSYHICENCSSMFEIGWTQGWISTICINCKDKPEYKNKEWKKNT